MVNELLQKYSALMLPLTKTGKCSKPEAVSIQSLNPNVLFPGARAPEAAIAGLLLLLRCWDESHEVSQDLSSREGSYWHAIAHRIERDSSNAGYWFRRVGEHPIFPELHQKASGILDRRHTSEDFKSWKLKPAWDPFLFIDWCDQARSAPGTEKERIALEIQRAEWDLLFHWCSSPENGSD